MPKHRNETNYVHSTRRPRHPGAANNLQYQSLADHGRILFSITRELEALPVTAPVMIVLATLILITEGPHMLYSQLRTGENVTPV